MNDNKIIKNGYVFVTFFVKFSSDLSSGFIFMNLFLQGKEWGLKIESSIHMCVCMCVEKYKW